MARIIGKSETGLLVEMKQEEAAQMLGPGYTEMFYGRDRREKSEVFAIGATLPIGEIWRRLNDLSRTQKTLDGVAAELRKVADWLDTVPALLEPPPKKTSKKSET